MCLTIVRCTHTRQTICASCRKINQRERGYQVGDVVCVSRIVDTETGNHDCITFPSRSAFVVIKQGIDYDGDIGSVQFLAAPLSAFNPHYEPNDNYYLNVADVRMATEQEADKARAMYALNHERCFDFVKGC